ncbi:hypothetical protein HYPSUDRAFT_202640 [Hypholoma sublateritium FD-334 SS-4]|uniref:Retroviral polymerase SH3-like domain-containing protein n=1 Tax=Hypholoma sublateritium (strain FD-334 SS-4) TaxID=945553 RepID=A0A0D2MDW5_HYPSF|nr:hypothetical protein HYPSUDRAFT_202640 [Hypholoma sublateritium FD-334 SS-4]
MEKCIFVGYPSGYKGWQFYNPSFPGLTRTSPVDLTPVGGHLNIPDALDLGRDNTFIPAAETALIEPKFATPHLDVPIDVPAQLELPAAPAQPAIAPNIPNIIPDAPNTLHVPAS